MVVIFTIIKLLRIKLKMVCIMNRKENILVKIFPIAENNSGVKFMNRFFPSLLFLVITIITINAQSAQSQKIDELLNKYHEYGKFNGAVLVADSTGVIFESGYGKANFEWDLEFTTDTKFRIGSVTKQFTAMAIMQLVQEGKLDVQDKLIQHLPWYREDTGNKITIEHLLVHTSGIPSYTNTADFFSEKAFKHYSPKELVSQLCMGDLEFEPGEKWVYNNSGYAILGAIIEEIEGKSYAEVLEEKIFKPLGMNNTGFDSFTEIIKHRADGYSQNFNGYRNARYVDMSTPYAAGSLYSTAEDLRKWDLALYTNKLLSVANMKKYFSPVHSSYAYGWFVEEFSLEDGAPNIKLLEHGGGINGFSSLITRDTLNHNLVVLLSNVDGTNLRGISRNILKLMYGIPVDYPKQSIAKFLYEYEHKNPDENIESIFNTLLEEEESAFEVSERELNSLGYTFKNEDKQEKAFTIFNINVNKHPQSSNVYDSRGEIYLAMGDTAKSIEDYKKSLELNPGNNNAKQILQQLGIEVQEEISVSAEDIKNYPGVYEVSPQFKLTVRTDGDRIFIQATAQPEFEVFPINKKKFYLKVVNAQIEFNLNSDGLPESLTLYQNGAIIPAKKVE